MSTTHRVRDEQGRKLYNVRCRYCKATWREAEPEGGAVRGEDLIGYTHTCAGLELRWTRRPERTPVAFAMYVGGPQSFKVTPIYWRDNAATGGTPTKCGGRCTHAKGGDCDCQCGGKNHGGG